MAEYVAKDKLWDTFDNEPFYDNADKDEIVLPIIDSFPAADVVPVVWCKDCEHSYDDIGGRICAYGPCVDCVVEDDFYCGVHQGADRVVRPYGRESEHSCRGGRPCPPLSVGGYIRAKNIEEAKRELAKQAAQCVEQMMLANDMFFVEGDKVSWRLRIYAEEEGDDT